MCAAQAADFRGPELLGKGTKWIYDRCREQVSLVDEDRVLSNDIRIVADWMRNTDVSEELDPVTPIK
jgi:histidine ammonia-lyase